MTTQRDTTTAAGGSPVERGVGPAARGNMRRVIRAARLCEELGHPGDTLAALEALIAENKRLKARHANWYTFAAAVGENLQCLASCTPTANEHILRKLRAVVSRPNVRANRPARGPQE